MSPPTFPILNSVLFIWPVNRIQRTFIFISIHFPWDESTQDSTSFFLSAYHNHLHIALKREHTRNIRKRQQNIIYFWTGGWRKPNKNVRNIFPQDTDCLHWELLLLNTVKYKNPYELQISYQTLSRKKSKPFRSAHH